MGQTQWIFFGKLHILQSTVEAKSIKVGHFSLPTTQIKTLTVHSLSPKMTCDMTLDALPLMGKKLLNFMSSSTVQKSYIRIVQHV